MKNVYDGEFTRVFHAIIIFVTLREKFAITSPKCGRRHLLAVILANSDVVEIRWIFLEVVIKVLHWTHVELLSTCNAHLPALIPQHLLFSVEICPSILATVYAVDSLFSINSMGWMAVLLVPADWIFIHLLVLVSKIDYAAIVFWPGVHALDCAVGEICHICWALIFKQSISAGLKIECRGHWEEQASCEEIEVHLCLVWF